MVAWRHRRAKWRCPGETSDSIQKEIQPSPWILFHMYVTNNTNYYTSHPPHNTSLSNHNIIHSLVRQALLLWEGWACGDGQGMSGRGRHFMRLACALVPKKRKAIDVPRWSAVSSSMVCFAHSFVLWCAAFGGPRGREPKRTSNTFSNLCYFFSQTLFFVSQKKQKEM